MQYHNDYLSIDENEAMRRQKLSEDLNCPPLPLREDIDDDDFDAGEREEIYKRKKKSSLSPFNLGPDEPTSAADDEYLGSEDIEEAEDEDDSDEVEHSTQASRVGRSDGLAVKKDRAVSDWIASNGVDSKQTETWAKNNFRHRDLPDHHFPSYHKAFHQALHGGGVEESTPIEEDEDDYTGGADTSDWGEDDHAYAKGEHAKIKDFKAGMALGASGADYGTGDYKPLHALYHMSGYKEGKKGLAKKSLVQDGTEGVY